MDAKTKTQSSRKGKKAWRKNIVVDDINSALEAKREREVLHGDADGDFVIDNQGTSRSKAPVSVLKTTEILTNKSKVPALVTHRTKQKIGKKRAHKLMVLAGRSATEDKGKARTDAEGLVKGSNTDLWAEKDPEPAQKTVPAAISYTRATTVPSTLKQAPLKLHAHTDTDEVVHAGKSYNPSLESWKSLIDREYVTENDIQMRQQALEQERERLQYLFQTLHDEEEDELPVSSEEEPEDEKDKYKLSVNEAVEVKKKTRTRRNREARHKQRLELAEKLKALKIQLKDLANLSKIEQEVDEKATKLAEQKPAGPKKFKRHSQHDPSFTPLEVKLSDELTNNLRGVKPEGNPFYEQMHKLQMSGMVEARVPVEHKRRYRQKTTEKWSYKNFK
ncbi:hypothetical protein OXX80_005544 [Metschnikowia pulcherrima]